MEPTAPTPPAFDPVRHRRGGRPPKAAAERRGVDLGFRATPDEERQIEALRAAGGFTSSSDYLRSVALRGREAQPPRKQWRGPNLGPIVGQLARLGNNLNQLLREARAGHFTAATEAAILDTLKALSVYLRKLAAADDYYDPED